jgi:hypothetical protein
MKKISPNPSTTLTKNPQLQNSTHNPKAHTFTHNPAEDCELELLAHEAFERSYYLHLAYSVY